MTGQAEARHFWHFALHGTDRTAAHPTEYANHLVVLSILNAVLASFAALAVVDRVAASNRRFTRALWVAVGGTVMGVGIRAMHFVVMLAFSLPVAVSYNQWITLLSVLPAIAGSTVALFDKLSHPDTKESRPV